MGSCYNNIPKERGEIDENPIKEDKTKIKKLLYI